jgi:hypothetical protein
MNCLKPADILKNIKIPMKHYVKDGFGNTVRVQKWMSVKENCIEKNMANLHRQT